ncbi:MAG: hypothetical protein QW767_02425 [Thermoprotei archaeon]
MDKDIEPADVFSHIKQLLQSEGFKVLSEDVKPGFWDLHAKKANVERIVLGRVRDVDVVVAGSKGKFEVQLNAGVWGKDLAVPAVEGVATLGVAAAAELHSAHKFEERMWEQIVHKIDPSLKICSLDGMLFKTDEELSDHVKAHEAQHIASQANAMNTAAMMGMMGLVGFGLGGMFMGGPGLWI